MHGNALKYWDFYQGNVKRRRGERRPPEKGNSAETLKLRGASVSPTNRPHDGSQCRDCTNHSQHQKTHHQEKRGPHIVEDNMVHLIALLCRSVSIGCATRSYKAKETLDHALSANDDNRGSALSTPVSSHDPYLAQRHPQGILQDVAYRIALSRPSVCERT